MLTEPNSLLFPVRREASRLVRFTGSGLSMAAEVDAHERENTGEGPDNGSLTGL